MHEPHWPDDIPPPYAALYQLGRRCLEQVNAVARQWSPSTRIEHELLEIARSQALAITTLSAALLRLRGEHHDLSAEVAAVDEPSCCGHRMIRLLRRRRRRSVRRHPE